MIGSSWLFYFLLVSLSTDESPLFIPFVVNFYTVLFIKFLFWKTNYVLFSNALSRVFELLFYLVYLGISSDTYIDNSNSFSSFKDTPDISVLFWIYGVGYILGLLMLFFIFSSVF